MFEDHPLAKVRRQGSVFAMKRQPRIRIEVIGVPNGGRHRAQRTALALERRRRRAALEVRGHMQGEVIGEFIVFRHNSYGGAI